MRILRIVASLDPADGGVVEAIRSSTVALTRLGHWVEVVSLDHENQPFIREFPAPVHALDRWVRRYGYTPRLARWIAEHGAGYDVGIIEGLWNHATIGGYRGLRAAGLPYLVFPHGMMDPWFRSRYPLKHMAKQAFWWALQGRVLRDAAAVAFTCEEEKRLARNVFAGPSYREAVVSLGIQDVPPSSAALRERFLKRLPELEGKPYLLFMSRIHPKKGCDLLIRAFAECAKGQAGIDLVMAGPDQVGWQAELISLARSLGIADRIHWPGMLAGEAKWGAIHNSDAFILPSHQENFGMVVAEAMACGKPVLTTDKVNIWHEVETSACGLIETDTEEGVRRLLQRWLSLEPAEKRAMAGNARKGFADRFHIDSAVRDLESLLQCVARREAV